MLAPTYADLLALAAQHPHTKPTALSSNSAQGCVIFMIGRGMVALASVLAACALRKPHRSPRPQLAAQHGAGELTKHKILC